MSIWFKDFDIDELNKLHKDSMVEHCDICLTEIGDAYLKGEMVVSNKIKQPFGIVHGGANCVLAETLGSIAGNMICDSKTHHAVGLSIFTSHIKAVRNGKIYATAFPEHIGRTTQVWKIDTYNDAEKLTSTTSLTLAIVKKV